MKNNLNPPFSLFREYVKQLMDYGKKFIIIGNMNAITYKEIFPYIKGKMMWTGYNPISNFNLRNGGIGKVICRWYTNIDIKKHNTPLDLYKRYSNEYPKYDNYDAIEVSKVSDIPMDYDGVMGVPITFLDKYCPTQFEIIGGFNGYKESDETNGLLCGTPTEYIDKNGKVKTWTGPTINKKTCYYRLLIRKHNA